jgi:predicted nucleic acid-binding protein
MAEFWYAATQPIGRNGLGFSFETVAAEHLRLMRICLPQRDEPAIFDVWEEFVLANRMTRGRIHDARLAAALRVHGFDRLLTFDTRDFARWGVPLLDPAALMEE